MLTITELCGLAEEARKDSSLLTNHRGTVDKKLRERLSENITLLDKIAGCSLVGNLEAELTAENAMIFHALTAYTQPREDLCQDL